MSLPLDTIVSATDQHVASNLSDEVVILDLRSGIYYGLDSIGTRIWELIQTPTSLATVRDQILEEYDVSQEQCEHDLINLIEKLSAVNLVETYVGEPPQ